MLSAQGRKETKCKFLLVSEIHGENPVEVLPQLTIEGGQQFCLEDGSNKRVIFIVDLQDNEIILHNETKF
jgi:hypothetical protein